MTISVMVTNTDTRESAIIAVTTVPLGSTVAEAANPDHPRVELRGFGGKKWDIFYVHSGQSLIISEVSQ